MRKGEMCRVVTEQRGLESARLPEPSQGLPGPGSLLSPALPATGLLPAAVPPWSGPAPLPAPFKREFIKYEEDKLDTSGGHCGSLTQEIWGCLSRMTDTVAFLGGDRDAMLHTPKSITVGHTSGHSGDLPARQQRAAAKAVRADYYGLWGGYVEDASHHMLIFIVLHFLGNSGKAKKGKGLDFKLKGLKK